MRQIVCRGRQTRFMMRLLAVGSFSVIAGAPILALANPPGCKSIAKGLLDVELPAGQRSSRMVRLAEGESVNFSIHSSAPGTTVTLVSGPGAPQPLNPAHAGSMINFSAPSAATYVFAIEAGRDGLAAVSASCVRQGETNAEASPAKELEVAQIEADAEGLTRRSAFSVGLSEFAATAKAATSPISQWCDAGEPDATAIDTATSTDDQVGAAMLSLSANAKVGAEGLSDVLSRMARVETSDTASDKETQAAMTWTAILAPDLSFEPPRTRTADTGGKHVGRAGRHEVASAQPAAVSEDWWVTHLKDSRDADQTVATETAVVRRDVVASTAFPSPPMALGAFIPTEAPVAALQSGSAQ